MKGIFGKKRGGGELAALVETVAKEGARNAESLNALMAALFGKGGRTLEQIWEEDLRAPVGRLAGAALAEKTGKVMKRMTMHAASLSVHRRSFRSQDANFYVMQVRMLLGVVFGYGRLWAGGRTPADYLGAASCPEAAAEQDRKQLMQSPILGSFLALEIDEGNAAVMEKIEDAALGDNNVVLFSYPIIHAIVKSSDPKMHELLMQMLLAARLQEGLRQAILENADAGTLDCFRKIVRCVLENDLLRYSAAMRAAMTWFGIGYSAADRRQVEKLATLGLACLEDAGVRARLLESRDTLEFYAALWATATNEGADVAGAIRKAMASGDKLRQMVALEFAERIENPVFRTQLAHEFLPGCDADLLAFVLPNLVYAGYRYYASPRGRADWSPEVWKEELRAGKGAWAGNRVLGFMEEGRRAQVFDMLAAMLAKLPKGGHRVKGSPFPWTEKEATREAVVARLNALAAFGIGRDPAEAFMDLADYLDAGAKETTLLAWMEIPKNSREKGFLSDCLSDKSISVRETALDVYKRMELGDGDIRKLSALLALKSPGVRRRVVDILLSLYTPKAMEAAGRLLAEQNANSRCGGLDVLTQLVRQGRADAAGALAALERLPGAVTPEEEVLVGEVRALLGACAGDGQQEAAPDSASGGAYTLDNGLGGLWDPGYAPAFDESGIPPILPAEECASMFDFDERRVLAIWGDLLERIAAHRDFAYVVTYRSGRREDRVFGAGGASGLGMDPIVLDWGKAEIYAADNIVLADVWRDWMDSNRATARDLSLLRFLDAVRPSGKPFYDFLGRRDNAAWLTEGACRFCEEVFSAGRVRQLLGKMSALPQAAYLGLGFEVTRAVFQAMLPAEARFAPAYTDLQRVFASRSSGFWSEMIMKEPEQQGQNAYHVNSPLYKKTMAELPEIAHLLRVLMQASQENDTLFTGFLAADYRFGQLKGEEGAGKSAYEAWRKHTPRTILRTKWDVCRAVMAGLLQKDELYRAIVEEDGMADTAKPVLTGDAQGDARKTLMHEAACEVAARVIDVELRRGDTPTEVTGLAGRIKRHEGAGTFARILFALGGNVLVRGYLWNERTKAGVLSSLLRACVPAAGDTVETLREALCGKVGEKRLLDAAMYAPPWLHLVSELLGWEGLESAAWYFHAHVNDRFSAEKETEVARWSPITPQEFNDGAFDAFWFHEAYRTLGPKRFKILYDCAKYIASGAGHRRAQIYADATLGRFEAGAFGEEVKARRSQMKLMAYGLIPLAEGEAREQDLLARYQFLQEFLAQSKQFGAMRRASEAKAVRVAMDNLARNAGYRDTIRFTWKMEGAIAASYAAYFEPHDLEGYAVRVSVAEDGTAALLAEKGGKALKSLPAALKKDPYVVQAKAVAASLKEQHRRARTSLERAMAEGDVFEWGELESLSAHPVIGPMVARLVFVDAGGEAGAGGAGDAAPPRVFFASEAPRGGLPGGGVRIAHPYDLFRSGRWSELQRKAFEERIVQPFKQIFRELYLPGEDERAERTVSRRYAGHQVQPQRTVGLLKARGWTVDYDEGLQRVYYKENLIAELYAAADWFSPAEIEPPTLEYVAFFDRKTRQAVPLEQIPPVVFSEAMRDVDLVVSVAHAGDVDPEASLSTIEMRAVIATECIRLLGVENARVDGRFIRIDGALGEYALHLGSGGVQMMGRGAIQILAVPGQHRGRVFLPFLDDNPRTAEILSKMLLLADDKKIKDPAILQQIKGCP
ncbi:MAG: DUF4132 domain-containing protein [Clostridiales Family XIII bacterium]|jgi:hypothetical protein|nr:DUF4132 domain-containing protein [Clostridiales Family XIII bacterium]